MPELPEVETVVRDLNKKVLKRTFFDVWTDFPRMIKKPKNFEEFKRKIRGRKIKKVWRRGKNIIFELSGGLKLLIHQKLTGHLLYGVWGMEEGKWKPKIKGPLQEKVNAYIHLLFTLDNNQMLALSDLRKFAKAELWEKSELENSKEFKSLGPEPLDKNFTFGKFKKLLSRKKKGKIKQVLMDQRIITGIGNIYSDEILWRAKIHPLKDVSELKERELKRIFNSMREILPRAINLGGESFSDFRRISGQKGYFNKEIKVYRRQGEKCSRCGIIIKRVKVGGRSAHFCPNCQPL